MKALKIYMFFAVVISCLPIGSCSLQSDKETDKQCDENKLTSTFDRYIVVTYEFARGINLPAPGHDALDAQTLVFTGAVRKMDCRDNEANYYDVNWSVPPAMVAGGKTSYKFTIQPDRNNNAFYYHFYNGLEYISVEYRMELIFTDGKVFKSTQTYSNTNRIKYWVQGDLATYTINMNGTVTWQQVL
jgi:hypothetical protein